MGQKELMATLKEIKELEVMQSEISDRIEGLKDSVKAEMVSQRVEKILVGEYKVSYTKYTTSRFDSKQFKVEHEGLYNQYLKTTEARRLTIK